MKLLIGCLLISLSVSSAASNDDDKVSAQSRNTSLMNGISASSMDAIPHYEGTNVEATQLKNQADLQSYALSNTAGIEVANEIKSGHQNRPKVIIDRENDPLFKRLNSYSSEADHLVTTISPDGEEVLSVRTCTAVTDTVDNTFVDEKTCSTIGVDDYSSYSCTTTWNAYCSNGGQLGVQTLTSTLSLAYLGHSGGTRRGTHSPFTMKVKVSGSFGNNSVTQNELRGLSGAKWRHHLTYNSQMMAMCNDSNYEIVSINLTNHNSTWGGAKSALGTSANYAGSYSSSVLSNPTCANGLTAQLQMSGTGTARRWKSWWKTYTGAPWYDVMSNKWSLTMTYKKKCQGSISEPVRSCLNEDLATGIADRYITPTTACSDTADKIVEGVRVSKKCWKEVTTYNIRQRVYTENPYCATLRSEGCGFNGSTCLTTNNPHTDECNFAVQTYLCSRIETTEKPRICNTEIYCPDGVCTENIGHEPSDPSHFATMATYLSLVQELASDLSSNGAVNVFTGEAEQCSEATLGFANCCQSGGWGTGIGLDSCSASEKILGLSRDASKTRYVGTYCSSNSIFGCLSKKQVYCVYPSKLSRILVEEGRRQIGGGFGSPRSPNCSGFTIAELEAIDFGEADLSDYFSDVTAEHGTISGSQKTQLMSDILDRFKTNNPTLERE